MMRKVQSQKKVLSVTCPDGGMCPEDNSCCLQDSGLYACCPLKKAVCCSDKISCCPEGATCDTTVGQCLHSSGIIFPMSRKVPAVYKGGNIVCPDGSSECPEGNTCCLLSTGQYGCCPEPKAVCCSDGVHCCPHGTTCDVAAGKCLQSNGLSTPLLKKTAAISKVENVVCPEGTSECTEGQTCCKLASGQYGCCPVPRAVCCSDGIHCCPHGTKCEISSGRCVSPDGLSLPLLEKIAAHSSSSDMMLVPATVSQTVPCPDGKAECPAGNTCCLQATGQYGCCPTPNAVCCQDGVHCCPQGQTCDTKSGVCKSNQGQGFPLLSKQPPLSSVICPDQQSECPDDSTCCLMTQGVYGCCPRPDAVCCSDHLHCCPHGTTCDVAAGKCTQSNGTAVPLLKKTASTRRLAPPVGAVDCPDHESSCPTGTTCCPLPSGQYGCCPLVSAVCCNDGIHCCPQGSTCDVAGGKCVSSDGSKIPAFSKLPSSLKFP